MNDQGQDPNGMGSEQDALGKLLRLAGPRPAVPAERAERVRAAAHSVWRETTRARIQRRRFVGLAAAAAVVAAIGAALWMRRPAPVPSGLPIAATVAAVSGPAWTLEPGTQRAAFAALVPGAALLGGRGIETGANGRVALQLSSGHSLRLDFGTVLRIEPDSSLRLIRGAIYIDSGAAGRSRRPVRVRTALGDATDIGTQFEVRLDERSMRVRVREGVVVVDRDGVPEEARGGTELEVDRTGVVRRAALERTSPVWGWTLAIEPPFELEGRSLRQFLDWASRETGFPVRFASDSLSRRAPGIILHGSLIGLPPDDALAAVLPTCGLEAHVENGAYVIAAVEPARKAR